MEVSHFLAKLLGWYLVIACGAMLVRRKRILVMMEQMIENSGLTLFMAIMTTIMGLLLVLSHNVWVLNWRLLVTLIAWLSLAKGVVWLYFPEKLRKISEKMVESKNYTVLLVVSLFFGFFLVMMGCWG